MNSISRGFGAKCFFFCFLVVSRNLVANGVRDFAKCLKLGPHLSPETVIAPSRFPDIAIEIVIVVTDVSLPVFSLLYI